MKKEEIKKLKDKDLKQLNEDLAKIKKEIFDFKMDQAAGKMKNLRSIYHKKKALAVIKTIIRQKELQK